MVHTWPDGARHCAIKGMFPEKFILFGEKMMVRVGTLYERTYKQSVVLEKMILMDLVTGVKTPLEMRYSCIKQSSWRVAIEVLLSVLTVGMEEVRDKFSPIWLTLINTLDMFLFPKVLP